MGYTTQFTGVLQFGANVTVQQLGQLNQLFRDEDLQLELADDFSGIQWDGSEKLYDMPDKVNRIIDALGIALTGQLEAQGEERNDRWLLKIGKDGRAFKEEIKRDAIVIDCSHCGDSLDFEMHRLEHTEDGHNKFWEVITVGDAIITRWGKIGTKGQSQSAQSKDAAGESRSLIESKLAKGYTQII